MAINKIKFRDLNGTNEFVVTLNPDNWSSEDSNNFDLVNPIGGSPFPISKTFDQRERTFTWPAHLNSNNIFTALIAELKRYKGQRKQLNTQDLDFLSHGWKNIKVTDVQTNPIRAGKGGFRMNLILKYIFIEEI